MVLVFGMTSCSNNQDYYRLHPKELQQAVNACPNKQPQGLTCQQLEVLAKRMNTLAYQLQMSPQGFGKKILALQETIAKEKEQLKTESTNTNLQTSLTQNNRDLEDYLAVVRWFESPTS
jgi:hypothetical protein